MDLPKTYLLNYDNRKFKILHNSENGDISEETIFHYRQKDNILCCEYSGGNIIKGQLIGLVDKNGHIDMRYHQINNQGKLMTGTCQSQPEVLSNGKLRLHERWQWTSGDLSYGQSTLEEI